MVKHLKFEILHENKSVVTLWKHVTFLYNTFKIQTINKPTFSYALMLIVKLFLKCNS